MKVPRALKIALVLLLASPLLAGCGVRDEESREGAPTLDEVYQGMRASAVKGGYVLHAAASYRGDAGGMKVDGSYEAWLDLPNDTARQLWDYNGRQDVAVLRGSKVWFLGGDAKPHGANACLGRYDHALCTLLGDAMPDGVPVKSEYAGRPVLDVSRQTELDLDGNLWDLEEHAYLDPETFLPVAVTTNKVKSESNLISVSTALEFGDFEWVAADSLSGDFFDPGEDDNPAAGLRGQSMNVFWLRQDVASAGDLPALSLQIGGPDNEGGVYLVYDDARQFGWNRLSLSEHASDSFVDLEPPWSDSPCTTRTEVDLPGGKATIFAEDAYLVPGLPATPGPCPADEPVQFVAHVWLAGTAISISAIDFEDNPWNSEEGMRQAILSLVPFSN